MRLWIGVVAISMANLGSAASAAINAGMPRVPFVFVENKGQMPPGVRYTDIGSELKVWFEDSGLILRHNNTAIKLEFEREARSPAITIRPGSRAGAHANFLYGNDPRKWYTDLSLFNDLHYNGVWQGIELVYKIADRGLKAEYVVSSGASAESIRLRFDRESRIQPDGTLLVHGGSEDFVESKPFCYQVINDHRKQVPGGFRKLSDGSIGFWIAPYDHGSPLVIDPSILFSGYFGGTSEDTITAVGVDGLNNVVTAGWTSSPNLPVSGVQTRYGGSVDAFVAAFLPNGGALIYCTYIGGSGDDRAFGLAIDSSRNVYVTGWTSSQNFPIVGAFQSRLSGTRDAFVTKLNASGSALVYSTYLGGSGVDVGYAIALNSSDGAIIVGDTTSSNLAVTHNVFQPKLGGSQDVFVAMLMPSGGVGFLTYLGGNGMDHASSVAVSSVGSIHIGGYTWSSNFPVVKAFQPFSGGGQDGFVVRMYPDGTGLTFSTYLGGAGGSTGAPEEVTAICLSATQITVAGTTSSANFPVTANAFQVAFGGQTDGFVAHFSNGGVLQQATYLGGALSDTINGVALDFHGNTYVTGSTSSQDFPLQHPLQATNGGLMDAFVVKMNTTLSSVTFGTYLGGLGSDAGNAIAVDGETSIIVAGQTGSGNLPVSGSLQSGVPSVLSSFITKIQPNFTLGVAYGDQGQMTFTADPWHVSSYVATAAFGQATDIPIVADWTGSGTKHIGVFRNGTWILDTNGNGVLDQSDKTVVFGQAGDIPVIGDWRGTGRIALGLFRQGTFILDLSGHLSGTPTGLVDATFVFGQGGDIPVAADWSGSGTTKVGVFRNGLWLVDYNGDHVFNNLDRSYNFGQAGDIPVTGDWDSSGNPPKIGIYRSGLWVLDYDGDNQWTTPGLNEMAVGFGFAGQVPLVF